MHPTDPGCSGNGAQATAKRMMDDEDEDDGGGGGVAPSFWGRGG